MAKVTVVGTKAHPGGRPGVDAAAKETSVRILSAPRGPRTVTHDQLKRAVTKVFRERTPTRA